MNDNNRSERIKRLMEELARMGSADVEGFRQEMQDRGEDPEVIRDRGIAFVRSVKGQLRLSTAGVRREVTLGKLEALQAQVRRRLDETGENLKDLVRRLAIRPDSELSVSFRKIESLDDNDALEILTEAELLDILEQMQDDEE